MKTKIVMFTRNRKWTLRPIRVGGNTIDLSPTVKLLGVTLDNKLTFNEHINKITKKATNSLMQCKRAVGPTWGLKPRTCRWIYTAVVRPILTYCAVIWVRALQTKHNSTKLRRVQALALRIMSGALPSTPFNSLNHITEFPDIVIFLKGEAAKGAARLQGYGDWTCEIAPTGKGIIEAHSTINNRFLKEADITKSAPRDLMKPAMILNRKYTIYLPNDKDTYRQTLFTIIPEQSDEVITSYTDGSKTEHGTGGGYIITTNNNTHTIMEASFKLPDFCTVYQAELIAITEAAKKLHNYRGKTITFWTDSLSSIQAISSTIIKSKTAYRCHEALSEVAIHNDVSVKWVAAHSGHWGNEKADSLAKAGSQSNNYISGPLPQSYIKSKINNRVKALNKEAWIQNGHRHTNLTLGRNQDSIRKLLNNSLSKNRVHYRTAVQLITGHAGLNKHLHTITKSDTEICPGCEYEEETVGHFLGQCPAYSQLRGDFFESYYLSINDIFDNFNLRKIVKFAIKTKRFMMPEDYDQSGVT